MKIYSFYHFPINVQTMKEIRALFVVLLHRLVWYKPGAFPPLLGTFPASPLFD